MEPKDVPIKTRVGVGYRAPDFSLPSHKGAVVSLRGLLSVYPNGVVLFFYPKDHIPGCSIENCVFRDFYENFISEGVGVVGISSDSIGSHERFAKKHNLPFDLLSDEGSRVRRSYGVSSFMGLMPGRTAGSSHDRSISRTCRKKPALHHH